MMFWLLMNLGTLFLLHMKLRTLFWRSKKGAVDSVLAAHEAADASIGEEGVVLVVHEVCDVTFLASDEAGDANMSAHHINIISQ